MRKSLSVLLAMMLLTVSAAAQDGFVAVDVAEKVKDSVVSIDANVLTYGAVTGGGLTEMSRTQRLLTERFTGFIYTENGYIITDAAKLEEVNLLEVTLGDGTTMEAEVAGYSEDFGIGVIKVESEEPLKPVDMLLHEGYDPDDPETASLRYADPYNAEEERIPYYNGDPVIAVGYSGGFGGTVTFGIISGLRNFRNRNRILLPNIIQSDVTINPGNEGCPLFNEDGQVIGMHDQVGAGMQDTTFFIPNYLITRVADEIIEQYERGLDAEDMDVWRPWLGIKPFAGSISRITGGYRTVGDDLKMYLDMPDQYWDVGILIDGVWQESPAREFGLLDKDWLMGVTVLNENEQVKHEYRLLKSVEELELMVTMAEEGDIFIFQVLRLPNLFDVEVQVGQHPGEFDFGSGLNENFERTWEYF